MEDKLAAIFDKAIDQMNSRAKAAASRCRDSMAACQRAYVAFATYEAMARETGMTPRYSIKYKRGDGRKFGAVVASAKLMSHNGALVWVDDRPEMRRGSLATCKYLCVQSINLHSLSFCRHT